MQTLLVLQPSCKPARNTSVSEPDRAPGHDEVLVISLTERRHKCFMSMCFPKTSTLNPRFVCSFGS